MNGTDFPTVAAIVGMTLVTVLTRSFFFLSRRPWRLPAWAASGLRYAPVAALAAVVVPEVVMAQGHLIAAWRDARLFAVAAGMAWYYGRGGMFGTILAGMAVYLPLHIGLDW